MHIFNNLPFWIWSGWSKFRQLSFFNSSEFPLSLKGIMYRYKKLNVIQ